MFGFVCKKLHFSRKTMENVSLIVSRFEYRANWDLKSGTETTFGLISTHESNGGLKI